jgi:hypothetical protein
MNYDLALIESFCSELGVAHKFPSDAVLEIDLGRGAVLVFKNEQHGDDCEISFKGTPWHAHGDFIFVGGEGRYVEVNHLEVLQFLRNGTVLIVELWADGQLIDRWLTHCKYNDEFKHLQPQEELRVWRPTF